MGRSVSFLITSDVRMHWHTHQGCLIQSGKFQKQLVVTPHLLRAAQVSEQFRMVRPHHFCRKDSLVAYNGAWIMGTFLRGRMNSLIVFSVNTGVDDPSSMTDPSVKIKTRGHLSTKLLFW